MRKRLNAVVIVVALLLVITIVDTYTSIHLNIQVAYFLPIMLAVWALGRWAGWLCAVIAVGPYVYDQLELKSQGLASLTTVAINVLVRVMVSLFVAEVIYRLVRSREKTKADADALASLNRDLKRSYARLDEDLNIAGLLQSTAMSVDPVEAPGCSIGLVVKYAGRVGGDYVDAGITNGRAYACVADISGKGTPAALFTTLLKYLLTEAIENGQHGVEMIESISSSLRAMLPADMFVTLFYAELDRATGGLECINAGHPEAYIHRSRTGNLEPVPHNAPLLGSIEIPEAIKVARLTLEAGDTLVIYSDGATDSKALDGPRLGMEPIRQIIPKTGSLHSQAMAEAIVSELESISRPDLMDDLSVVCVRYTGGA